MRRLLIHSIIGMLVISMNAILLIDASSSGDFAGVAFILPSEQRQRHISAPFKNESFMSERKRDGGNLSMSYLDSLNPSSDDNDQSSIDEEESDNKKNDNHPPALQILEIILTALSENNFPKANNGLSITFDYSSDNCRASLGGSLEKFIIYANNPTFGFMIDCDEWSIEKVGTIIAGSPTRVSIDVCVYMCNVYSFLQ